MPGERIGSFKLGDALNALVTKQGDPTFADMALGRGQAFWVEHTPPPPKGASSGAKVVIGVLVRRTPERVEDIVDQIVTNSGRYHLGKGTPIGAGLSAVRRTFPSMKLVPNETAPVPSLYDSADDGIAFEFDSHFVCRAIIVHRRGSPVEPMLHDKDGSLPSKASLVK